MLGGPVAISSRHDGDREGDEGAEIEQRRDTRCPDGDPRTRELDDDKGEKNRGYPPRADMGAPQPGSEQQDADDRAD